MPRAIVLNSQDNVATLIDTGQEGVACTLQGEGAGTVTRTDYPNRRLIDVLIDG